MEWNLEGKRIIVTGASRGLGRAMAEALLQAGAEVALASRREDKLQSTASALKDKGFLAHTILLDVRDQTSVDRAVDWVIRSWGTLDMVVNNAGLGMIAVNPNFPERSIPFFEVEPAKFKEMFDTNVFGYFLVSSTFARLFIAQKKRGRIVNISANKRTMIRAGFVPYGPSRAASEAMSFAMAEDLEKYGIGVNLLLPGGPTKTDMFPGESIGGTKATLLDPSLIDRSICFLASDEATGLTGQRIIATEFEAWLKQFRSSPR